MQESLAAPTYNEPIVLASILADRLAVVLVAPRNPLNIGAAARAASNFGFSDLRVVSPYPLAFQEARSAVGAAHVLTAAKEFLSVPEAVADCGFVLGTAAPGPRIARHPLDPLPQSTPRIYAAMQSGRVAILFGSEKHGLTNHDLSFCHRVAHIPTHPRQPSMNLGQAVAIVLYEMVRGGSAAECDPRPQPPAADGEQLERLTELLLACLRGSEYLPAGESATAAEKIRRCVHRLSISAEDASTWTGMLRQIDWKLRARE